MTNIGQWRRKLHEIRQALHAGKIDGIKAAELLDDIIFQMFTMDPNQKEHHPPTHACLNGVIVYGTQQDCRVCRDRLRAIE